VKGASETRGPASATHISVGPPLAWGIAGLAGIVGPVAALMWLAGAAESTPLLAVAAPILAVGLMGTGMIAAAADGRLWVGIALALLAGLALIIFALALGMPALARPLSTALVFVMASLSFAARGALFARSRCRWVHLGRLYAQHHPTRR